MATNQVSTSEDATTSSPLVSPHDRKRASTTGPGITPREGSRNGSRKKSKAQQSDTVAEVAASTNGGDSHESQQSTTTTQPNEEEVTDIEWVVLRTSDQNKRKKSKKSKKKKSSKRKSHKPTEGTSRADAGLNEENHSDLETDATEATDATNNDGSDEGSTITFSEADDVTDTATFSSSEDDGENAATGSRIKKKQEERELKRQKKAERKAAKAEEKKKQKKNKKGSSIKHITRELSQKFDIHRRKKKDDHAAVTLPPVIAGGELQAPSAVKSLPELFESNTTTTQADPVLPKKPSSSKASPRSSAPASDAASRKSEVPRPPSQAKSPLAASEGSGRKKKGDHQASATTNATEPTTTPRESVVSSSGKNRAKKQARLLQLSDGSAATPKAGTASGVAGAQKKEPPKRPSNPPPSDAVKRVQEERAKQMRGSMPDGADSSKELDEDEDSELSPQLLSVMITTFHDYLVMILYTSGGFMAEQSLSRLSDVDLLFKWPIGRRIFASSLNKFLRQLPSPCLTEDGFEVILLLMHKLLAQIEMDKDVENDWIVASVIMNAASTLYRIAGDSTQYLQEFVKPYKIWKDILFWSNCFWDAIAEQQEQGRERELRRKQMDLQNHRRAQEGRPLSNGSEPFKETPGSPRETQKPEKILSSRLRRIQAPTPSMVSSQLCTFAYNMLSWSVRAELIRELIDLVCELTALPEDKKKSLVEIVESFQASVIVETKPAKDIGSKVKRRRQIQSECYTRLVFPDNVNSDIAELREVRAGGAKPRTTQSPARRGPKGPLQNVMTEQDLERVTKGSYIKKLLIQKVGDGSPETGARPAPQSAEQNAEKESQVKALVEGMNREVKLGGTNVQEMAKSLNAEIYQEVQLSRRDKVLEELLATEKSYVDHLTTVVQSFIEPCEAMHIISKKDAKVAFSNIRDILELNKMFYQRLEERMRSWPSLTPAQQVLSDIFMQVFPFMKIYAGYCANYLEAAALITKLETGSKFRSLCRELVGVKGLDLFSYLIMPVQRIPRYQLLLQEIMKETSNFHPDFKKLSTSLDMVKSVAGYINNSQASAFSKVIEIQMQFGKAVSLIEPWRKYVRSGKIGLYLAVPNLSNYSYEVHAVNLYLFNDVIVLSKEDRYLGQFLLSSTWLRDLHSSEEQENMFQLYSPTGHINLVAEDLRAKYEWIKHIVEALTKWIDCIPAQKERREAGLPSQSETEIMDPFIPEHIQLSLDDPPPFSLAEFSTTGYIVDSLGKTLNSIFTVPPAHPKRPVLPALNNLSVPATEAVGTSNPATAPASAAYTVSGSGSHVSRNAPQQQILQQPPRAVREAPMQQNMVINMTPRGQGSQINTGAAVPTTRGSQVGGVSRNGSQVGNSAAIAPSGGSSRPPSGYKPAEGGSRPASGYSAAAVISPRSSGYQVTTTTTTSSQQPQQHPATPQQPSHPAHQQQQPQPQQPQQQQQQQHRGNIFTRTMSTMDRSSLGARKTSSAAAAKEKPQPKRRGGLW
eukprot:TRINITY_DN1926_c1_g1_i1.p1 TRINITY_DN1926_c1_g1~~TRINITY_DN1926_c1_g1_i1.p1  ORF type:complete len:1491 (+),score=309.12 TRINITY_DN1926_c1_g1_i1:202-4674(+)